MFTIPWRSYSRPCGIRYPVNHTTAQFAILLRDLADHHKNPVQRRHRLRVRRIETNGLDGSKPPIDYERIKLIANRSVCRISITDDARSDLEERNTRRRCRLTHSRLRPSNQQIKRRDDRASLIGDAANRGAKFRARDASQLGRHQQVPLPVDVY